ncbi:MAG: folylpolyglutamate synthase/dihydrofolate synthase family protein [Planctomycetota bacterium]
MKPLAPDAQDWLASRTLRNSPHAKRNTRLDDSVVGYFREVAEKLGNPHKRIPIVHVAGSKGKGTTAYLVAWLLEASGIRAGLSMSPHLTNERERALVSLKVPSSEAFSDAILEVARACDAVAGVPTYSGVMSLAALVLFNKMNCRVAVMECGLGGARDATGFLGAGVCVLTGLEREHTVQLGETEEEIAREKAAIAGKGAVLVSPVFPRGVREAVVQTVSNSDAILREVSCPADPRARSECLARSAAAALGETADLRVDCSADLGDVVVPCRSDLRRIGGGNVLFDGAHTPASLKALAAVVKTRFPAPPRLIFGVTPPRDVMALIAPLAAVTSEQFVVSGFEGTPKTTSIPSIRLSEAADMIRAGGDYVVTGSFHLAGELMMLAGITPFPEM